MAINIPVANPIPRHGAKFVNTTKTANGWTINAPRNGDKIPKYTPNKHCERRRGNDRIVHSTTDLVMSSHRK